MVQINGILLSNKEQTTWMSLKSIYKVKKAKHKKLQAAGLQISDILEKTKLWRQKSRQWLQERGIRG